MYDVPRFAEFHRPDVIICENVPQVRYWECWDAWLNVMLISDNYNSRALTHSKPYFRAGEKPLLSLSQ